MNLSLIALSAIVISNVCFSLGFGTLAIIPHKKHSVFMLTSSLMILIMSAICSSAYYFLYNYVFVPLDMAELALFALTIIVLLVNFIAQMILKNLAKEVYFHYEKNFTFVVHVVVVLGMALASNLSFEFPYYLFSIGMQFLGLFAVNIIFFALNSRINNKFLPEQTRALPPQLALMSVLSLIGYLVAGLFM